MTASLTAIARRFAFVREFDGPNRGAWVEFFQRFCSGSPGESWCMYWLSVVLDIAYHGKSPLRRTGSCAMALAECRMKGYMVHGDPQANDLYFYVNPSGHAHHVGIVTATEPLTGIAGNTSEDGLSSNGVGVFEHVVHAKVFARLPT